MCSSTCSGARSDFKTYRITEDWHISDEDTEEEDSIDLAKGRKSTPAFVSNQRAKPKRPTGRNRNFSLEKRMQEWHRSMVVDRKAECAATQYIDLVKDDTLMNVRQTVCVASSITDKGADINKQLRRQEQILYNADLNISYVENETDQLTETLKGMSSLRGKLSNNLRKWKPKRKVQTFNDIDLVDGEVRQEAMSRRICSTKSIPVSGRSPKDTKEQQIKAALGELNAALNVIKVQQMDTAWALDRQKGHLAVFENKFDSTHSKIHEDNEILSGIISKS